MKDLSITSVQNPRIKSVLKLAQRNERDATGLFTVEGARELERAIAAGYELIELFHWPGAAERSSSATGASGAGASVILSEAKDLGLLIEVSEPVFAKLAVREGTDGLFAVLRQRRLTLADLKLSNSPLVVAVQGIEKPGNLGALLRTADGAGVEAVIVLDEALDLYNPNVLRASLGTAFSVPVAPAKSAELRTFAKDRRLKIVAAALTPRANVYHQVDLSGPLILLLGEEAKGLSQDWLESADVCVQIPMQGAADSLNLSAAGAVLMFEARRQRAL